MPNQILIIYEKSLFWRKQGKWYYMDGTLLKPNSNR